MNNGTRTKYTLYLRASKDIERVKRQGKRLQTPFFNLMYCQNSYPLTRVGVIVGRRLGKAVVRNRTKRIFRELFRAIRDQLIKGQDILIFPKSQVLDVTNKVVQRSCRIALQQVGLLGSNPIPTWRAPSSSR